MITWPAVIKFEGDHELSYVASQAEWEVDEDLSHARYAPMDQLIDSNGLVYSLNVNSDGSIVIMATGETITLDLITTLLREHASQLGNCCVSKLGFHSISEAVRTAVDLSS